MHFPQDILSEPVNLPEFQEYIQEHIRLSYPLKERMCKKINWRLIHNDGFFSHFQRLFFHTAYFLKGKVLRKAVRNFSFVKAYKRGFKTQLK